MRARSMSSSRSLWAASACFTVGHLTKLVNTQKALVLESEELLSALRRVFKTAGLDQFKLNVRTKLLGQLDTMVARFALGKQEHSKVQLESLAHARQQAVQAASQLSGWSHTEVLVEGLGPVHRATASSRQLVGIELYGAIAGVQGWAARRRTG